MPTVVESLFWIANDIRTCWRAWLPACLLWPLSVASPILMVVSCRRLIYLAFLLSHIHLISSEENLTSSGCFISYLVTHASACLDLHLSKPRRQKSSSTRHYFLSFIIYQLKTIPRPGGGGAKGLGLQVRMPNFAMKAYSLDWLKFNRSSRMEADDIKGINLRKLHYFLGFYHLCVGIPLETKFRWRECRPPRVCFQRW